MKVNLHLTNDWELYGDGSGDFFELQVQRLQDMLNTLNAYNAKVTLFADVAQQWAHQRLAPQHSWADEIAEAWEQSVEECLLRGHDVQLHIHPPWLYAKWSQDGWHIPSSPWRMISLGVDAFEKVVRKGRLYLDSLGRPIRADYRCLAFRANAYCIQPLEQTLPALQRAGILCDSSVVNGCWDYLHFDFRQFKLPVGPSLLAAGILEMPICTVPTNDRPILRKVLPQTWGYDRQLGSKPDPEFALWAKQRDRSIGENCKILDPLHSERQRQRFSWRQWPSFFKRQHFHILDYDYMSPETFVRTIELTLEQAKLESPRLAELKLVAVGHCKNAHTTRNLERTLKLLQSRFGRDLSYSTLQDSITHARGIDLTPLAPHTRSVAEI